MTITRRTFNRGALSLLATAVTSKPAIAQTQEEGPMLSIEPFTIQIPDAAIADLNDRLAKARFPHAITDDWSRGQPLKLVKALTEQWRDTYDWRAHEAELNRFPHFMTEIDGQPIHFMHIKSPVPDALPLILSHGWPGSFVEFLDVIGPLTDPKAHGLDESIAFHLVIPSLPGFGFSSPMTSTGWDSARTAQTWDKLMKGLGYERYGAHGGDAGALATRELGILAPEGLVGVHMLQIFAFPSGAPDEMSKLSPFEMEGMANLANFEKYGGYQAIQSKRPGTLAFGLVDSPVGQLAWNAELWFGFEGTGVDHVDRERYLTTNAIYWFTGTSGSAANVYYEDTQTGAGYREINNPTPTGVAVFPEDFRSVRSFAERSNNIVHWTEMPRGGHFAASETPDLLIEDIRTFFGGLVG
ncbi:epoxide hydrolase [Devosia oryziradicis]|uniref:Epoxide hydrolase n=1 Tax=Devosia oryziradicis TaxID=2801335 RepID=A0ABX7BWM6_9HYPH|nr:epoxide hydrolase family protein [Devosia oryziradicis]QQR36186.1 epoxide hydrolase [Devosia oryziradicis]